MFICAICDGYSNSDDGCHENPYALDVLDELVCEKCFQDMGE